MNVGLDQIVPWNFSRDIAVRFSRQLEKKGNIPMLHYALVFFILALVAGLFGFGGVASASAGIAQILFFLFLILFAVTVISRMVRGR